MAVLVWIPPVVEQLTTAHGNLSLLFSYFTHPPQSTVGLHRGLNELLIHLNPLTPLTKPLVPTSAADVTTGYLAPCVFLALWAAAAVTAWRLQLRSLGRLNAVIGIALVLGVLSISRIFGLLLVLPGLVGLGDRPVDGRRRGLDGRVAHRPAPPRSETGIESMSGAGPC